MGCIVIGTLGLILLVVVGVIAVVLIAVGGDDGDTDAALVELERIVDETPLDDGIGDLASCPVGRTTAVVDDLIDRIDDDRLTTVDRAAPGTFDDQYVVEYPESGTRVVVCERTGDDPSIAAIGIGLTPRPDDLRAYLEDLTGTTDIEIEGEPDIGETAGTVLRWICVESDDPFARFCEMLWDDGDLLLSFYVAGASSGRLDVEALLAVLDDVVDDWIEALAG